MFANRTLSWAALIRRQMIPSITFHTLRTKNDTGFSELQFSNTSSQKKMIPIGKGPHTGKTLSLLPNFCLPTVTIYIWRIYIN